MKKTIAISMACLYAFCSQSAAADDFKWDMSKGAEIKVMLSKHPYSDALQQKIADFEKLTGVKVHASVIPEENYFDKLTTSLNSRNGDPDIFMTGAYQIWAYAPAEYIEPLDDYVTDKKRTAADYDFKDFFEGPVQSLRWDLVPGHKVGTGNLWALPIGFETNYLTYNKKLFEKHGLKAPKTIDDLYAACKKLQHFDGKDTYGLATRGTRNWATIHPGYMTTFANFGATDFAIEKGKLVSKVDSPESVKMNDIWLKMIKECGSPTWASYTWYQASADVGAGKAAILFDASAVGFFQNAPGNSKEAGNLAYARPPVPEGQTAIKANLWTWSLAMNKASKNKDAAWLFVQYFTGKDYLKWAATGYKVPIVDTPRQSVFNSPEYTEILKGYDGYKEAFEETVKGTIVQFTPHPHFFETTTAWAATLQNMAQGKYKSTQEALTGLKKEMDEMVEDVEIPE